MNSKFSMYAQLGKRDSIAPEKKARNKKNEHFHYTVSVLLDCSSLSCFITDTHLSLSQSMLMLDSEATKEDFEGLKHDLHSNGLTGEYLLEEHQKTLWQQKDDLKEVEGKRKGLSNIGYAVISLAYLVEAEKALEKEDREKAWSQIAKARFFCGVAAVVAELPSAISKENIKRGSYRGQKSADVKWGELKEAAFCYVREKTSKPLKWTRYGAAKETVIYLGEYVKTNKKKDGSKFKSLSTGKSGISTVARWFKEMPEVKKLFEWR